MVFSADGEKTVKVDMRKEPPIDGRFVSLGEFKFEKNGIAYVMVSNEGTKGHVCPDAVVFISLDKKEQAKEAVKAVVDQKAQEAAKQVLGGAKPGDVLKGLTTPPKADTTKKDSTTKQESQLNQLQNLFKKKKKDGE